MSIKNKARIFLGLIIAAGFVLTACHQPNSTTTAPAVPQLPDELKIKDLILPTLKEFYKTQTDKIDFTKTPAEVKDDIAFTNSGLTFGTVTDVSLEKIEVTPADGSIRAAGTALKVFKKKTAADSFTVKFTFKKGGNITEYELKVVNSGTKDPVDLQLDMSVDKNVSVHGVKSLETAFPNTADIEVPAEVTALEPAMIQIYFQHFGFIAATEVTAADGSSAAPALAEAAQAYMIKFAASDYYNETSLQLRVKKAAAAVPPASPKPRIVDTAKQSNILGKTVQLSDPHDDVIEVVHTALLTAENIKIAFQGETDLVTASEVKDTAGTGDAPALSDTAYEYTIKFAATQQYESFALKLKLKKAAAPSTVPKNFTGLTEAVATGFITGYKDQGVDPLGDFPITKSLKLPKSAHFTDSVHGELPVTIVWVLNPASQEGVNLAEGTSEDTLSFTSSAAGKDVTLDARVSASGYNTATVRVTITTAQLTTP